ncbi:MAG: hypothetical protein HKN37_13500 [Rhodothermales bacterium]|nr:hypothetical protein [Rhodothermales bacterium]
MGKNGLEYQARRGEVLRGIRIAGTAGAIVMLFTAGLMGSDALAVLAQTFGIEPVAIKAPGAPVERTDDVPVQGIVLTDLEHHPDVLHADYFRPADGDPSAVVPAGIAQSFRQLLTMYKFRQAVDDNFTARAYSVESGDVLKVASLEEDREQFAATGSADWQIVDRKRRRLTSTLVDDLVTEGNVRNDIRVRWGRRNQVVEARDREASYLEHEIRLASHHGLSLLATEIGTVETFNNDRLVSRVGARSRYQMMPAMLRARGVHHYRLRTRAGTNLDVREEWHPMITMQAAFVVVRAYSNAVGHEIPGLSAYHTGPYNIFRVYREYLTSEGDQFGPSTNVVTGYLWALTDGFEQVSKKSSFKNYSRGYVLTLHASLRATEEMVADTTATIFAEQIQLQPGNSLFLSELLQHLDGSDERVAWRVARDESLYERFRIMNPHFKLPPERTTGSVPEGGDVFLVATATEQKETVRFFLPLGATAELMSRGVEAIDYDATIRYDRNTFDTTQEPHTVWDELYAALVEDVRTFGFTFENRARLAQIADHMEEAAMLSPSLYRQTMRDVVRLHERVWASDHFARLARVVPAARGRQRLEAQPPSLVTDEPSLRVDSLDTVPAR